jgi:hypothetical protein
VFDCAIDTACACFPESSAHIKDESKDNESDEKPSVPAAVPLFEKKDNSRKTKKIKRQSELVNIEMVTRKKARLTKDPHHDGSAISEVKQQDCKCGVKTEKKKRKYSTGKVPAKLLPVEHVTSHNIVSSVRCLWFAYICCFMFRSPKMQRMH